MNKRTIQEIKKMAEEEAKRVTSQADALHDFEELPGDPFKCNFCGQPPEHQDHNWEDQNPAPEDSYDWPDCDHSDCENPAMWIGPIGVVDDFRCDDHMSLVDLPGAYQHLKTNEYYGSKPVIFYDL